MRLAQDIDTKFNLWKLLVLCEGLSVVVFKVTRMHVSRPGVSSEGRVDLGRLGVKGSLFAPGGMFLSLNLLLDPVIFSGE